MDYAALQGLVEAIEDNNQFNDARWSDWYDSTAPADLYEIDIDDDIAAIIDRAIASNGKSLAADLRAAELSQHGQNFDGDSHWINVIERKHAS